jgi:hypothetical protein
MNDLLSLLLLFSPVLLVLGLFVNRSYNRVPSNEIHAISHGSEVKVYPAKTAYFYVPFMQQRAVLVDEKVKLELPEFSFLDKMNRQLVISFDCIVEVVEPQLALSGAYPMELSQIHTLVSRGIESTFQSYVKMRTLLQVQTEINQLERSMSTSIQETIGQYGYNLVSIFVKQIQDLGGVTPKFY